MFILSVIVAAEQKPPDEPAALIGPYIDVRCLSGPEMAAIYEPQFNDTGFDSEASDDFNVEITQTEISQAHTSEEPRYPLTDSERALVCSAVMAEARGESFEGQMMVAQCILDGAERNGLEIAASIKAYQIVTIDMAPTDSVLEAVAAVFDRGERVTEAKADLWYAPASTYSAWHEAQQYVCSIGGHKFFWCNRNIKN